MQGPQFFDNEIVQPSNWEFWRDSNETNIKNNFLVLTDGYPGVAAAWSIVNNGPDITISPGFGYDGNGERLETFSGVNFTPLSGTNVVYARLALSDYNPQLGSGSTVTAVDVVTGLNLPVETYNTVEFTNISGAAYIPIACVEFSGGAVQSFSVASGCRNHLLMFDGSIDVYDGIINLKSVASGSIPCSALASPFLCNLIMNSGASISFNQSGTSSIGTPSFPAAFVNSVQGNFHILSGLSPILLNSSITQNNAYSIETDASAGARLKLDTLNRGVNVGGPLYANNLRNLSGPMSLISNAYLTISANTGMAISTSNDMAISMPNTLTFAAGSYSFRNNQSNQQMANINSNLTAVYNAAEFSSGISFATAGTSDIGSVAKPAKAVYANNLYIGGAPAGTGGAGTNKVDNSCFTSVVSLGFGNWAPAIWNIYQNWNGLPLLTLRPDYQGIFGGVQLESALFVNSSGNSSAQLIRSSRLTNNVPGIVLPENSGTFTLSIPISDIRPSTSYSLKITARPSGSAGGTFNLYGKISAYPHDVSGGSFIMQNVSATNVFSDYSVTFNMPNTWGSDAASSGVGLAYLNMGANSPTNNPSEQFSFSITNVRLAQGSSVAAVDATYGLAQNFPVPGAWVTVTNGASSTGGGPFLDIFSKGQFVMINLTASHSYILNGNQADRPSASLNIELDGASVGMSATSARAVGSAAAPNTATGTMACHYAGYLSPGWHTVGARAGAGLSASSSPTNSSTVSDLSLSILAI